MQNIPARTAATCVRESCDGCAVQGRILCIHTAYDVAYFYVLFVMIAIPGVAGMIIGHYWVGLTVYFGVMGVFLGLIENSLCSRCPNYAEKGRFLRCHANWGVPKLFKFLPRPMNWFEKALLFMGAAFFTAYFIPFLAVSSQWILLSIYCWAVVLLWWTWQRYECVRCYNYYCPLNRLPQEVRDEFLANNPSASGTPFPQGPPR